MRIFYSCCSWDVRYVRVPLDVVTGSKLQPFGLKLAAEGGGVIHRHISARDRG